MTSWALSFGWNWALVPMLVWLGRQFWLATREKPLKYLQHTRTLAPLPICGLSKKDIPRLEALREACRAWENHLSYPSLYEDAPPPLEFAGTSAYILDVERRERMFPWRRFAESWLVTGRFSTRESDGLRAEGELHDRFLGIIAVAEARRAELEELSK